MNGFTIFSTLILLSSAAEAAAAPGAHPLVALDATVLYVALMLAFLGMSVGVFASVKRGLNVYGATIGGFLLGPLALLLFLVPARTPRPGARLSCPHCGASAEADAIICGRCHRELAPASPQPTQPSQPVPAEPKAARRKAVKVTPQKHSSGTADLSSEFAQYSEMLRKSLPGVLEREVTVDYAEKLHLADEQIRCSNPTCNRLLPPPHSTCPHCGTPHF